MSSTLTLSPNRESPRSALGSEELGTGGRET